MVASPRLKLVDELEKQLDKLLSELEGSKKTKRELEGRLKKVENSLAGQKKEIERMRRKASDLSGDLDIHYRRKREEIQEKLAHLLARLESL